MSKAKTASTQPMRPLARPSSRYVEPPKKVPPNKVPDTRYAEALQRGGWISMEGFAERVDVTERTVRTWLSKHVDDPSIEIREKRDIPEDERPVAGAAHARFVRWIDGGPDA